MKEWPDNGTVRYDELIEPLRKILERAMYLGDDVYENGLDYDNGYNIGRPEQATHPCPDEALSKDNLKYGHEEQDRDVYDVILNIVFMLGVEQGRRTVYEKLEFIEIIIDNIISQQKNLKDVLDLTMNKPLDDVLKHMKERYGQTSEQTKKTGKRKNS